MSNYKIHKGKELDCKVLSVMMRNLTLPVPSLLVPTPYNKGEEGGGAAGPPVISTTVAPMNLKFCRALETCFNVLKMFKLFTKYLLGYHSSSSKERCFIGKIARFQPKIPIFNHTATKFTVLKIIL